MAEPTRRPWNAERLERALRRRLATHPLKLKSRRLITHSANCAWEGDGERAEINVDTMHVGWLRAVIHELLHVELADLLEGFGDLEEPIVEALEDALQGRIKKSRRRYLWWRRAIEAKVGRLDAKA